MSQREEPIRLVHVVNAPQTLPSFLGRQARYMQERGFEVTAISDPTEPLRRYGEAEGIRVEGVAIDRGIAPHRDMASVWRLWRVLRRLRPHVVHAHTPKAGLIAMTAATLAGVPLRIYHVRGLPLETAGGWKRRLLWLSERLTCALAHRVLCVSPSIREVVVAEGLCACDKAGSLLHGSGNGVDAAHRFHPDRISHALRAEVRRRYNLPLQAPVIGYVGRVIREKGIVELADAWTILRERFPQLHLLVVGPFEPHDPVPAHVRRLLDNDERVRLAGAVWDTPPLYAVMDVLAFPTYREGFGMVAIEAAAMRVPVVATRIPGCVDSVADGVTGTLAPPRDAAALAEALDRYLRDPALRRRHGAAGRARALRDFAPERLSEATFAEYVRLLEQRGLPAPPADRPLPQRRAA